MTDTLYPQYESITAKLTAYNEALLDDYTRLKSAGSIAETLIRLLDDAEECTEWTEEKLYNIDDVSWACKQRLDKCAEYVDSASRDGNPASTAAVHLSNFRACQRYAMEIIDEYRRLIGTKREAIIKTVKRY